MEIKLKSKWLQECVCKFLNKDDNILKEDLKEEIVEEADIFDEEIEKISMESSKFEESLVRFEPYEGSYIKEEYEEDAENESLLNTDDFKYFTELEGLRFMDCCIEIHKIDFLKYLNKLRILELGTVSLESIDGVEELKNLEELCIWRN